MSRPIYDSAALWRSLTAEQQEAIGIAAIDREIVLIGVLLADSVDHMEVDDHANERLETAIDTVLPVLDLVCADEWPMPSCAREIQRCRVCGCTDRHACPGRCSWVEPDLCSACVGAST